MNDFEASVVLNMIPSLGSVTIQHLLEAFERPAAIFQQSTEKLAKVKGMTARKIQLLKNAEKTIKFEQEIKNVRHYGFDIIALFDTRYPTHLKTIYDPPIVLYVYGELLPCDDNAVAIVGSRRASYYGLSTATRLAHELADAGITVVAGLARGIDTAGHNGALQAHGRTIAVLGSGLDKLYPPENKKLADAIAQHGAVVSAFSLGTPPLARNFPQRNRIISGFSLGVVVVEAARNSGALITAHIAVEQSRDVFAVPGKLDSQTSVGTHALIKEGAKLVTTVADILEEIQPRLRLDFDSSTSTKKKQSRKDSLKPIGDETTQKVYKAIGSEPIHIDTLSSKTNLSIAQLSALLMNLRFNHCIEALPGNYFVKKET